MNMDHPTYSVKDGIQGANPGSFQYKHEARHEWQERKYGLVTLAAKIEMPLLTIGLLTPLISNAFIPVFIYTGYRLLLEADATLYAARGKGVIPGD